MKHKDNKSKVKELGETTDYYVFDPKNVTFTPEEMEILGLTDVYMVKE